MAGLEGTEQGRVRRASPEGSSGSPITSKDLMQQQKKYTENLGSKASLSKKRIRTMEIHQHDLHEGQLPQSSQYVQKEKEGPESHL